MSATKKKRRQTIMRKNITERELRKAVHETADDAVKRTLLLAILAARDEFKLNGDKTMAFMKRIDRYVKFEGEGLVSLKDASESLLKNTGIDLRLVRWKTEE